MLVCTCQRTVSYLMAEASYRRRVVGDIAWAMGVVPVKRAQDAAVKGIGQLTIRPSSKDPTSSDTKPDHDLTFLATGFDTAFLSQLKVGDKVRPSGTALALKVQEIVNDSSLVLEGTGASDTFLPFDSPRAFDILKRVDQKQVYEKVLERIANGGAIGACTTGWLHLLSEHCQSHKRCVLPYRHLSRGWVTRSYRPSTVESGSRTHCILGSRKRRNQCSNCTCRTQLLQGPPLERTSCCGGRFWCTSLDMTYPCSGDFVYSRFSSTESPSGSIHRL